MQGLKGRHIATEEIKIFDHDMHVPKTASRLSFAYRVWWPNICWGNEGRNVQTSQLLNWLCTSAQFSLTSSASVQCFLNTIQSLPSELLFLCGLPRLRKKQTEAGSSVVWLQSAWSFMEAQVVLLFVDDTFCFERCYSFCLLSVIIHMN